MARGGYTFQDIQDWSAEQIYFVYHYQELQRRQQQDFFASSLGIVWDKQQMMALAGGGEGKGKGKPPEKVFVPLSAAINPQIIEFVQNVFGMGSGGKDQPQEQSGPYIAGGDYKPKPNEKIVPMSSLSKKDFLALLGRKPAEERDR